jgi:hypothetical protein
MAATGVATARYNDFGTSVALFRLPGTPTAPSPVPAPPLPPAPSPVCVIAIPAARFDSILPAVVPLFAAASLLTQVHPGSHLAYPAV